MAGQGFADPEFKAKHHISVTGPKLADSPPAWLRDWLDTAGVSYADYRSHWEAQAGCCAICGDRKRLRPDVRYHEVKGLLCTVCVSMLAGADFSMDRMGAGISYLDRTTPFWSPKKAS